jgi:hypothetical protein
VVADTPELQRIKKTQDQISNVSACPLLWWPHCPLSPSQQGLADSRLSRGKGRVGVPRYLLSVLPLCHTQPTQHLHLEGAALLWGGQGRDCVLSHRTLSETGFLVSRFGGCQGVDCMLHFSTKVKTGGWAGRAASCLPLGAGNAATSSLPRLPPTSAALPSCVKTLAGFKHWPRTPGPPPLGLGWSALPIQPW